MKDITVILPLHKYDKVVMPLLKRALDSVDRDVCNIVISTTKEVYDTLGEQKDIDLVDVTVQYESVEGSDEVRTESDFSSLVNFAVNSIGTKWFSILEFDDVYTDIWFKNVNRYMDSMPDVSVFLSLTDLFNHQENDEFIGYGNEAPWASSFSNEIGFIDNDCLQNFFDFYMTGAVFNTEDWKNCGGLKPSIKLTFWYEFLLRLTNKGKKLFVIPKIGYKHYLNVENSLYSEYKDMSEKEADFWYQLAKKDCFFTTEKEKSYYTFEE